VLVGLNLRPVTTKLLAVKSCSAAVIFVPFKIQFVLDFKKRSCMDYGLLDYDITYSCRWLPVFQRNLLPQASV
jgi:hypothetical protein